MYSRELYTFVVVAEKGSFLSASKELFITPASVMNQINKFENRIGIKLIERTNHGILLTNAGKSIYKDAKKIIRSSDQALTKARQVAMNESKIIKIGTSILRPCKMLVDLWSEIEDETLPVTIHIVPFDDTPDGMEAMLSSIGKEIDCFVGPCDSIIWRENYNIQEIGTGKCEIAVPRKHQLAKKKTLCWNDLSGETIMLVRRGDSLVLNQMRDDIEKNHPQITVIDAPHFYDANIFNECERSGCLMETLDIWIDVHPSIVTVPMKWDYEMPYGIIYSKHPSAIMELFIDKISSTL